MRTVCASVGSVEAQVHINAGNQPAMQELFHQIHHEDELAMFYLATQHPSLAVCIQG